MKILILGCTGQVGWELQRSLAPLGDVTALDRRQADLADAESLRHVIRDFKPQIIVNAAAYTAVDKAESEPDLAYSINAIAPSVMAHEAKTTNAWLVHYSTDYVFDGKQQGRYTEADATGPLSVYGRTKLEGERVIQESGCKTLIFRTSWVYAARGNNFAKTMLRLAKERDQLQVVGDQWGTPTSAELIADITAHALHQAMKKPELAGLYHLTASGETNWHGYACHVLTQAQMLGQSLKVKPSEVAPIATTNYPLPAARPKNSRLDTTKLQTTFGLHLPDWQVHVNRMLKETLGEY
ncbi:MAG: dTDP-4-dehydrorhamnose reductase [Methylobacter sp.]|nr:dTDP-4-dehydrorhamnose reductase [Methylobacter sp.]